MTTNDMSDTSAKALRVLQLIADGYKADSDGMGQFVRVENPDYWPDNGHDPYIVLDVKSLASRHPQPVNEPTEWQAAARRHAVALEQCAIFAADVGKPIAKAMTDAAAFLCAASIPAQERSKEETDAWIDSIMDQAIDAYHAEAGTTADWDGVKAAIKVAVSALETPPLHKEGETRKTFVVPDGFEAVRDADGRATGEVRPIATAVPVPVPVTITDQADYLVWSNEHRAWWRANSQGYSRSILDAGRYTRAKAVDIADKSRNGWKLDQRPDEIAVAIADLPPPIRAALSQKPGEQG